MDKDTQIAVYSTDPRFFDMLAKWSREYCHVVKPVKHISTEEELYAMASNKENIMLFYFTPNWSNDDNDLVRRVKLQHSEAKIILVSTADVALSAWRRDAFYFVPLSKSDTANDETAFFLNHSYKKFAALGKSETQSLTIKYNGQLMIIPFQDICYIKADGNYCDIVTATMKKITITKQLGKMVDLCKPYPALTRIGKSLIINTNRVKDVHKVKREVHFLAAKETLLQGLSDRYITWIIAAIKGF